MQIRVNAEPAAFYRLVVFISLHPCKDPSSSEHPCCIHVSHRSESPVAAARAFCPLHPTAVSYSPDTLFSFAFCTSSAEVLHSRWSQLFFFSASLLTSPEAWYRFGASLETIADVLPGPYLEDCSRSHCILSGCSPRDLLQVASGPILLLLTCVSPEGMLAVAWPPYLCLLL